MKKSFYHKWLLLFGIFLLGSFIGFVHENLLTMLKGEIILRTGLLYEPLIPIYGIGVLAFYLAYHNLNLKKYSRFVEMLIVFLIAFFMGGAVEYFCSLIQENVFGTISWDYSNHLIHLQGRTSLFHSSFWGLTGMLFYLYILPWIEKQSFYLNKKGIRIFLTICCVVFIFDASISTMACYRQAQRRHNMKASNAIEVFLDIHYNDEYLNRVYSNAHVIENVFQ